MSTVYLVELDTVLRVRDWKSEAIKWSSTSVLFSSTSVDWSGKGGVFTRTLPSEVLHVLGVSDDGTALTKAATAAGAEDTPGSWYYDVAARKLTIRTTDGSGTDATTRLLLVTVLEPLALPLSLVKTRESEEVFWDGRVIALPAIVQELSADLGEGTTYALGQLIVANEDGRYERLLGERLLAGQEVRIYRGDDAETFTAFDLWLKGVVEDPVAGVSRFRAQIMSVARKLDNAVVTTVFATVDYPAMDPAIAGLPIPKIWGSVFGVEAYRIASGRWKVAGHAMAAITAAVDKNGTAVTIATTDLPNGEFTVNAINDAEERLYVDGRGKAVDKPGETIESLGLDAGLAASKINATELDQVDVDRAVKLGLRIAEGSYREALNAIATSAFVDWFITREDVLTAKARKRDAGNLLTNPGFETDVVGWTAENSATISRVTSPAFHGAGAGQLVKPAAQGLARASTPVNFIAGRRYTVTLMAALVSGTTTAFRVSLVDFKGTEYLSDAVTLSSTKWTRISVTFKPADSGLYWSSTTLRLSDTATTFSAGGGTLKIYPQYNGADDVTVAIDDLEVVESILLDDDTAEAIESRLQGPVLWRVRVAYRLDARTGIARFIEKADLDVRRQFPTAESRELLTALVDATDATAVADAILDYYEAPRMRFLVALMEQGVQVKVGDVGDAQLDRAPTLPGSNRLFRVAGFIEETPEGGLPTTRLELEGIYDPIFEAETITAS